MPSASGTSSFAEETRISNFYVFSSDDEEAIKTVEGNTDILIKTDMLYTVYVTGAFGSLSNPPKAVVEIQEDQESGPVPLVFDTTLFN